MKTKISVTRAFYALAATCVLASCHKDDVSTESDSSTTASSNIISVAASAGPVAAGGTTDSLYLVQPCGRGEKRDSIAQSALPATINNYLSANYGGATFSKAYALKNSSATLTGYVVVIYFNDSPVGLQFDANGSFVKVLEQREKGDLNGSGFHRGGRFEHRDGQQRDSIAIAALPAAISSYLASNYGTDTLVKAFRVKDSSVVVLSINNGVFATVFSANNTFVKRVELPTKPGRHIAVEVSAVPAAASNYLTQTYPGYVLEKAFSFSQSGTVKGYVVLIVANSTRYAVEFDAAGSFVRSKTIQ